MFCDHYPRGWSDIKQRNLKWFRTLSGLVLGFLLFGSSLRWDSVCIASAGHKPLNSRVARGVDQPFSHIGIDRIPIRPDVGAPMPAGLTGEPWLDIRKPGGRFRAWPMIPPIAPQGKPLGMVVDEAP
jgi:hypothetical protein